MNKLHTKGNYENQRNKCFLTGLKLHVCLPPGKFQNDSKHKCFLKDIDITIHAHVERK